MSFLSRERNCETIRLMRTWGKLLTWGGLAVLLISVIAGLVLAVNGFTKLADTVDNAALLGANGAGAHTTTKRLDAGQEIALYATARANTSGSDSGYTAGEDSAAGGFISPPPTCEVTGPATPERRSASSTTFTFEGSSYRPFAVYRITVDGEYTFSCDGPALLAPPLSIRGIFTGVGGVLLAVFGGGFGGLIAVVGIILWVVGANRAKRSPNPYAPGPNYGYGPPPDYRV